MSINWSTFASCPLCDAGPERFSGLLKLDSVRVQRCVSCGLMFLNPYVGPDSMREIYSSGEMMARVSDRLRHYYERPEGGLTDCFYEESLKVLESLRGQGSILDVGCGRGYFLVKARERGWKGVGLEPSLEQVRYAKEKFGIEVVEGSLEDKDFKAKSFDVVSLWDLIEHVPNPKETLEKVLKWLKDDGFILLATPNHQSLLDFVAWFLYRGSFGSIRRPLSYFFVPEHVLYFTVATLKDLVKRCGLQPIREIPSVTDIDRYSVSKKVKILAKILLALSRILRAENRVILICQKLTSKRL